MPTLDPPVFSILAGVCKRIRNRLQRNQGQDDDGKDLIADEIFTGDADGDLEEGETVDVPIQRHEDEEGEDEESGEDTVSLEMV
jgi:hypothetical protein